MLLLSLGLIGGWISVQFTSPAFTRGTNLPNNYDSKSINM